MRVVIAGGHGKIALRLERLLAERGDQPVGLIRNPDQAQDLETIGAEAVVLDLEKASVGDLAAVVEGADAVVFAYGPVLLHETLTAAELLDGRGQRPTRS
jgi:nucleoside-diphosphate-sugar epimerase